MAHPLPPAATPSKRSPLVRVLIGWGAVTVIGLAALQLIKYDIVSRRKADHRKSLQINTEDN